MNTYPPSNSLLASVRIYRALLVAYPKPFRENFETHMVQVFRDSIREAYHHNGIPGVVELWIHTFVDLVLTALNERIMERSQSIFSPKVVLWGGVASVFGGLLWIMSGLAPSSAEATMGLALVLGLGGLISLYSRQVGQGGKLGLAGFTLGIIGTGLTLATLWGPIANSNPGTDPVSAALGVLILDLGMPILGLGLVLLGVASLRAKNLHRWRGLPLGLGFLNIMLGITIWLLIQIPLSHGEKPPWPGAYLPVFAVCVLLGLCWIIQGSTLASEAEARIVQPPPASA